MRREELQDVFRLAVNMAHMGIVCVQLFFLTVTARHLIAGKPGLQIRRTAAE